MYLAERSLVEASENSAIKVINDDRIKSINQPLNQPRGSGKNKGFNFSCCLLFLRTIYFKNVKSVSSVLFNFLDVSVGWKTAEDDGVVADEDDDGDGSDDYVDDCVVEDHQISPLELCAANLTEQTDLNQDDDMDFR